MLEPDDFEIPVEPIEAESRIDRWTDQNLNTRYIKNLETSHLMHIIEGLESGKGYYNQAHKLPRLKQELEKRLKS